MLKINYISTLKKYRLYIIIYITLNEKVEKYK